jgi:Tetratricopeptide repeat
MNKFQYFVIVAAATLFCGLYFGFDTKNVKQRSAERSRSLQGEATSLDNIAVVARQGLNPGQSAELTALERQLDAAPAGAERIVLLKRLSGLWYRFGALPVSGGIAGEVAELENSDTAWSTAGATFYQALTAAQEPALRSFCAGRAVKAFENAASLNPAAVEHRVNLALVYAENPPPDNPMQAVLMLRDLENKHPENPSVYNALGRLALKTGQWDRAIQRLEKARSLDPKNPNTPCLLAKAYEGGGQNEKAAQFAALCK